ncbi:hypothetical protein Trydic_g23436 [Trypoxylus dichotomus]
MEFVPVTIRRDDSLPDNICYVCLEKLNYVMDFREMVTKSHEALFQQLENNEWGDIKIELEDSKVSTDLHTDWKENFNERDQNCVDNKDIGQSLVDLNDSESGSASEITLEKLPKKLYLKNFDRRNNKVLANFNKEQLKAIVNNPDCKKILESGMSRKERTNAMVFCQECNKSYSFRYYIGVHAHIHIGNLPFKCEFCEFRVPKRCLLRQHMRSHSKTKNFLCTECGKAFSSKQALKTHVMRHSSDRPFKCDTCGKSFKTAICLQNHYIGHQNVREFVCEECGKSFKHKRDLQNHKAIHVNKKDFECTTCGKKFLLKKRLDAHMKRHSNVKPFTCSTCGMRFATKPTWQSHTWIHTGEKPFSCDICGKRFRQRGCLPRHMKMHTGEAPHCCTICPEKFKYSQQLVNHMKKHDINKSDDKEEDHGKMMEKESEKIMELKEEIA